MNVRIPYAVLVLAAALFAMTGCGGGTGFRVNYQSLSDPGRTLDPPAESSMRIVMGQMVEVDGQPRVAVIPDHELTLPQRHMLAEIERGAERAGFNLVDEGGALTLIAYDRLYEGEYDTYQRVPVFESHSGTVHTSRGFRTYYGSATRSVVVPQRKAYAHRQLNVVAYPSDAAVDWSQLDPDGSMAVWMGSFVGDVSVVDPKLAEHVHRLLEQWGRTEERALRYPRPKTEE